MVRATERLNMNTTAKISISVILFSGVIALISEAAQAQGISEYGALHSMPRNIPSKNVSSGMNRIYGSAAQQMSKATGGSTKSTPRAVKTDAVTRMLQRNKAKQDVIKLGTQASSDLKKARELSGQKKYDEALKLYSNSLRIRLQYWKDRDKEIPQIYSEMAEIYYSQGKLAEAKTNFEGAMSATAMMLGPGTKETIKPLIKLAEIYDKQGETWKSHDHYQKALILTERFKGKDSQEAMDLRLLLIAKAKQLEKPHMVRDYMEAALKVNGEKKILSKEKTLSLMENYRDILNELNSENKAKDVQKQIDALKSSG